MLFYWNSDNTFTASLDVFDTELDLFGQVGANFFDRTINELKESTKHGTLGAFDWFVVSKKARQHMLVKEHFSPRVCIVGKIPPECLLATIDSSITKDKQFFSQKGLFTHSFEQFRLEH